MVDLTRALLVGLVLMAMAGTVATAYLWRVFLNDHGRPRSLFIFTVCIVCSLITAATVVIGTLAGRRLLGFESIPGAVQITALSLLALEAGPVIFALVIYRVRRYRNGGEA